MQIFFRLLRAQLASKFHAPGDSIFMLVAAVIYFVSPSDLIPDSISVLGLTASAATTNRRKHRGHTPGVNVWCGWRIVISPTIPQDSPSCYHTSMRHLVVLFIHFLATLFRLLRPGGVRSIVSESLILKHQLLIVTRSRQRSPNLCTPDRILAGLMALLVRPTRLLRSAIVLKPSTLLALHKAMSTQKYRLLFSASRRRKPARKVRAQTSSVRSSK